MDSTFHCIHSSYNRFPASPQRLTQQNGNIGHILSLRIHAGNLQPTSDNNTVVSAALVKIRSGHLHFSLAKAIQVLLSSQNHHFGDPVQFYPFPKSFDGWMSRRRRSARTSPSDQYMCAAVNDNVTAAIKNHLYGATKTTGDHHRELQIFLIDTCLAVCPAKRSLTRTKRTIKHEIQFT